MVMAPIPSYWLLVEAVEHAQCQRIELVPSDMLSKALKYARKREANLRRFGLRPSSLCLEVTETKIMRSPEQAERTMDGSAVCPCDHSAGILGAS